MYVHYAAESVHWNTEKHALDDRAVCSDLSVFTNLRLSRSDTSIVCLSSNVRCAFFAMVVSPLVGCHPEICWKYDYNRRGSAPWTPRFIALCFHRSKEKEQHAQCCSCVTLDAAQVAPQRCLILHLRESNYIIFDYQPEFNRLEKGLEELLPPLFLQW